MSYKIAYAMPGELEKQHYRDQRRKGKPFVFLAIVFLAITLIFSGGHNSLQRILFPGDHNVSMEAFSQLIENMRAGESAQEAVTSFCQQILDEAYDEAS